MSDDELIGRFMPMSGIFYLDPTNGQTICEAQHLQYSSSWDWIMRVVSKINRMAGLNTYWYNVSRLSIFSSIATVYKAVVEFIKWYNENKTV